MPADSDQGGYTICAIDDAPDFFEGKYPGEMRFLAGPLAAEQVALSCRRMPPGSGGKGSYGHRHRTQEEVYLVLSGRLEFKLEDEVVELGPLTAVRVAPGTTRSVWNGGSEDAVLLVVSTRIDDLEGDVEFVGDFWPAP
jgi:mannose-6-phosphate isomerase-like protein (cupin superfamily)